MKKWQSLLLSGTLAVTAGVAVTLPAAPAFADEPLSAPTNLHALHVSDTSADLDWLRSGLAGEDVVERQVNGAWQEYTRTNTGFLALTSLTPAMTYTFRVRSLPIPGIGYTNSPPSAPVSLTTLSGPDGVPPSKPPAPVFSSITTTRANVSWAEATDNVEVTGYHLQQLVAGAWTTIRTVGPTQRFQSVSGLTAGSSYSFAVIAFDAKGNQSLRSDPGILTTLASTATLTCRAQLITYSPGFTANFTVINTTPAPVSGWKIQFTMPVASTVSSTFGGSVSRTGTAGTMTPAVYYATVTPGNQATLGFIGSSYATPFGPPTGFTIGGVPCAMV